MPSPDSGGKRLYFRPFLWMSVFFAPVFVFLVGLGVWQLQRLSWKKEVIDQLQTRSVLPAVPLSVGEEQEFRRVRMVGDFLHSEEFFWVRRSLSGRPGLHVMTPFREEEQNRMILVDRGWIPPELRAPSTRQNGQISGTVALEGLVRFFPLRHNWFMPENEPEKNLWFRFAAAGYVEISGVRLESNFYILADTHTESPFPQSRQWRVGLRNPHFYYAMTWFGIAGSLLWVYGIFHVHSGRLAWRRSRG